MHQVVEVGPPEENSPSGDYSLFHSDQSPQIGTQRVSRISSLPVFELGAEENHSTLGHLGTLA